MPSPWKFVYRHRNPDHPDLCGAYPNEAEAREYRGLHLVPVYSPSEKNLVWGWWELRHAMSRITMFLMRADGDEAAEEYAAKVAELANWQFMRSLPAEWSAPPYSQALIDYLRSTKGVFYHPDFDALLGGSMDTAQETQQIEDIIPYRKQTL